MAIEIVDLVSDPKSKIRGVGRYIQLLKDSLPEVQGHYLIHPFFNPIQRLEAEFCFKSGCQKIAVIHDLIPLKYPAHFPIGMKRKIMSQINALLLSRVDKIMTDSHVSKHDIRSLLGIPEEKIYVTYPYADTRIQAHKSSYLRLPNRLKPFSYLLYVGDVNWNKNIVTLAKAVLKTNLTLVCVGASFSQEISPHHHPWQSELYAFQQIAKSSSQIITPGFVDDQVLADLYTYALYNILLSYDEGFGFSYLEASNMKTPSILADTSIFHEISGDKGCVFTDHTDPDNVAQTLHILINDSNIRQRKSAEAYERSKHFTQKRFVQGWLQVLA